MKGIILLLCFLVIGLLSFSQANIRATNGVFDRELRIPLDTFSILPDGSFAYKNGTIYYKYGFWRSLSIPLSSLGSVDTIIGHFINETFTSPSALPSSFANHGATLTYSAVGLRISGAHSTFYGGYISGTAVSGSLNNAIVTEFVTEVKPAADSQGVYVGKISTGGSRFDLAIKCKRVSTSLWKAYLYLNANLTDVQLVDSTNVSITMGNFEKYRLVYNIGNGFAFCSFARIDSTLSRPGDELESSSLIYRYDYRPLASKSVPNVGQAWIGTTGGTYRITKYDEIHADLKHVFAVHFGTSISTRYSAYSVNNTWVNKLYEGTSYKYALLSGGGERIVDFITKFQQAKAMHPTVIFIEGGVNETNHNDVRAYLNDIIDSCQLYGYIPVVVKTWSNPERDSTMFNVCKSQNVLLIDAGQVIYPAYEASEGAGGVHILAAAYEKVANIVRTQMLASGYMEVGRNVQGTGFGDLTDYEYLGLDDGFVPVFDTSSNRRRYKAKDLKVYLNGSYIKNDGTTKEAKNFWVTNGSMDFLGVGTQTAGTYLAEIKRNTASNQQALLFTNTSASGSNGEISVGGGSASFASWQNAFYDVAYTAGGRTFSSLGGFKWDPLVLGTTKMTFSDAGLYIGGSAAATHALTVNGQVRITAVTASTNGTDSVAVFSGGVLKATNTITSGTYTPTLTNVTNLDASSVTLCQYMRVGNTVTVSGKITVDPTATGTVQLRLTLPIASALTQSFQVAGTAAASGIAGQVAAILGDAANDEGFLQFVTTDVTSQAMYFSFTYQIL